MYCRRCGSPDLEDLPPSLFSRNPGHRCEACGARMRPRWSGIFYLFVIVLGFAFAGAGCWPFVDVAIRPNARLDEWPWGKLIPIIGLGLACAGWAAWQLRLPTPRK